MKKAILATAVASLLASSAALAEDKNGLSGSGEAGFSNSTGNTETEALYAKLSLDYTQTAYKVKGLIEADNKKESGIQTRERYVGDFQADLFFSSYPNAYGFGQIRGENDRFASIDLNSYVIAGLGYNFYKEDNLVLSAEAGVGNQSETYTSSSPSEDFSQVIGKLYGNFEYGFNANVRFLQDLAIFTGDKQTRYETNTGLSVKLSDNLNMKASYKYRHNDTPAAGKEKVDTETLLTLIYNF